MIRFTLILVALLMFASAWSAEGAQTYKDVSVKELKEAIAAKTVTILDVNGSTRYAKGHIPTAKDFAAIKDDLAKNLPENKGSLIVAYCGGPKCGAYKKAAAAAVALGYTNVAHLSAGISGWEAAGESSEAAK